MIDVERRGPVAVILLNRPKVNALSPELVEALLRTVEEVTSSPDTGAVVLGSRLERVFSAGFDLKALDALEGEAFARFFGTFALLYRKIVGSPVPVVASVGGHALAGGAILVLACERRVFGRGEWGFGLTEVDLGLPLPPGVLELLRDAVDPATAYEAAALGRVFKPSEAAARGLAHRLVAPEAVLDEAVSEAAALAGKPREALGAIRKSLRGPLAERLEASDRNAGDWFRDWWSRPEAVARRRRILERLSSPRPA